ncbi:MAG TPA: hypothetical protein VFE47_02480 [Tepidisphaeraceae bacterium]|jgi:hypothetical protein|nr:hypothetical protein [Tepidisphaeraceae bacterium]
MAKLIDKVSKALEAEFPGATTELELVDGKVWGYVLWKKFVGMESIDRVCRLSAALRHYLGKDYRKRVSSILPFTPLELKIMREENARPQNY